MNSLRPAWARYCGLGLFFLLLASGCTQKSHLDRVFLPFTYCRVGRITDDVVAVHSVDSLDQEIYRIDDNRYGSAFHHNGQKYFLGESMSPRMELERTPLLFHDTRVYSWLEVMGAACGCTNFVAVYDGEPILLLSLEGQVSYHDFDNDGNDEIIVTYLGINPPQVGVVFWNGGGDGGDNGGAESIDVNRALKAAHGIRYEDGHFFVFAGGDGADEIQYAFDGESFTKTK